MSSEADPSNREGSYFYEARVRRDWYDDAVENARNDPKWKDNPSAARHFTAVRVERQRR